MAALNPNDAVIVATARSPIGRAFKGSLTALRPDDLAATIVRAALDKVPQLDPRDIADLYLGCGLPGGESGFNMARVVAILLGYDHLPGATTTRYCASSLQTTRTAFHAIKAGEGRSEEHTSELQSRGHLVCRLLLEKTKKNEGNILTVHTTNLKRGW